MPQGRGKQLSGGRVPETGGAVAGPRQDGPAIGAEGHGADRLMMPEGRGKWLCGARVPETGDAVVGPRQDSPAVGAEGHGPYSLPIPKCQAEPLAEGHRSKCALEPFVIRPHQVSSPPPEPFAVL